MSFDAQGTLTTMMEDGWGNTKALCYLGDGADGAKFIMPPRSFMAEYLQATALDSKAIDRIWRKYDRDLSGHLDERECEAFLTDLAMLLGGPRSESTLAQAKARMSEAMDSDGNGRIDREEFETYMHRHMLVEILKPYTIYYHSACAGFTGRATPIMMLLSEADKAFSCKEPAAFNGGVCFAPPMVKSDQGVQLSQLPGIMIALGAALGLAPEDPQQKAVAKQAVLDAADMLSELFSGKLTEDTDRANKFLAHFDAMITSGSGYVAGTLSYADFMVFLVSWAL